MKDLHQLKVALISESLTQLGGAENVLMALAELFPDAPIYTPIYDKKKLDKYFGHRQIITSSLQKIPFAAKFHRLFFGSLPRAFESFDLSDYHLIISNTSAFSKGVIAPEKAIHICYMHTPTRYIWSDTFQYVKDNVPKIFRAKVRKTMHYLRLWDFCAAQRPDIIFGNSQYICRRIKKYYRREAETLYPFADTEKFILGSQTQKKDFYLMTGRLVSYKRYDIAIKAFNNLPDKKLVIAGGGIYENDLRQMIKSKNIQMLGRVSLEKLAELYQQAKGYIFTAKEDFGITPLEALACGTAVIAYQDGGVMETVSESKTGVFFAEQTEESLAEAIKKFESMTFNPQVLRQTVLDKFTKDKFKENVIQLIEKALNRPVDEIR